MSTTVITELCLKSNLSSDYVSDVVDDYLAI